MNAALIDFAVNRWNTQVYASPDHAPQITYPCRSPDTFSDVCPPLVARLLFIAKHQQRQNKWSGAEWSPLSIVFPSSAKKTI